MTATSFLGRMAAASRDRVGRSRAREPEARLLSRASATPPPLPLRLRGFDLIAELKLRSPAAGGLGAPELDRASQVAAYARGGAAVVSVLTEPLEFNGELAHLAEAAAVLRPLGCPVMRKDFLTDPYQVIEARAAGASGVLVIVTMLDDAAVGELVDCAAELGLFVLAESFAADDLARLERLELGQRASQVLAGVNCRNLDTLDVDFGRFEALAAQVPKGLPAVAESGVRSCADIEVLARFGYGLALVGSALMRTAAVQATVAEFIAAGRAVRSAASCS